MNEFLAPILPIDPAVVEPVPHPGKPDAVTGDFANWFSGQLAAVNQTLMVADHDVQKLAVGATQNLHEVMIHLEEARLSFQLLAQVRNKVLDAYQEVMRMQV